MICPVCGKDCVAEMVDNGVGMQQCGPYVCMPDDGGCGWTQPSEKHRVEGIKKSVDSKLS